jgi:hypothetical protein
MCFAAIVFRTSHTCNPAAGWRLGADTVWETTRAGSVAGDEVRSLGQGADQVDPLRPIGTVSSPQNVAFSSNHLSTAGRAPVCPPRGDNVSVGRPLSLLTL